MEISGGQQWWPQQFKGHSKQKERKKERERLCPGRLTIGV